MAIRLCTMHACGKPSVCSRLLSSMKEWLFPQRTISPLAFVVCASTSVYIHRYVIMPIDIVLMGVRQRRRISCWLAPRTILLHQGRAPAMTISVPNVTLTTIPPKLPGDTDYYSLTFALESIPLYVCFLLCCGKIDGQTKWQVTSVRCFLGDEWFIVESSRCPRDSTALRRRP